MAVKDVIKVNVKTFFNPRAWLGYDLLKENTQTTFNIFKEVFAQPIPQPEREETFAQAVARFDLTDDMVAKVQKRYFTMALAFAVVAIIVLMIGIILVIDSVFSGFILALSIATLFFAQAFKYHFWYFQIKHKKLGCTFQDWYRGLF